MAARKLTSRKGLDKFDYALVSVGLPVMMRLLRSKKQAKPLMDEIHKEIFELGPPTPPHKPTGRTRHRQWLMHHSSEISRSLDTMRDIEFYVKEFPYRKPQIAKHRHLQFHVEAFLHEIYILQEKAGEVSKVHRAPAPKRPAPCRRSRPCAKCSCSIR